MIVKRTSFVQNKKKTVFIGQQTMNLFCKKKKILYRMEYILVSVYLALIIAKMEYS